VEIGTHPKGSVTNEGTLISITLQKIDVVWIKHGKTNVDNWDAFPRVQRDAPIDALWSGNPSWRALG
jgi:hypothetical protein